MDKVQFFQMLKGTMSSRRKEKAERKTNRNYVIYMCDENDLVEFNL